MKYPTFYEGSVVTSLIIIIILLSIMLGRDINRE